MEEENPRKGIQDCIWVIFKNFQGKEAQGGKK
jgi:hypothetical protein